MRQRRLVQPAFHHNQLIKYADMMTTLAIRTRNWWSHGDPVNVAAQMKKLTNLNLARSKITDKGLESIEGLRELTYLDLGGTSVTDAGLGALRRRWRQG